MRPTGMNRGGSAPSMPAGARRRKGRRAAIEPCAGPGGLCYAIDGGGISAAPISFCHEIRYSYTSSPLRKNGSWAGLCPFFPYPSAMRMRPAGP
jgi:hypothetical protein